MEPSDPRYRVNRRREKDIEARPGGPSLPGFFHLAPGSAALPAFSSALIFSDMLGLSSRIIRCL